MWVKTVNNSLEFVALENVDELIYMDRPVTNDSLGRTYISGSAVLMNDTLLRFEHQVYTMENGVLFSSFDEMYDMVRK